jgi:NAD dependent epimerase/dehydratase family enzyme
VPDTWNFSIQVATSWEKEANEQAAKLPHTRMVLMRTSILMSPDPGGAFEKLLLLVRLGLGGANGSGKQFISWMHEADFVRSIQWLIDHEELRGPMILAAPNPLPNRDFMHALRAAAGVTIGLPSFEWMLEIGAVFLQTETELILKSRRVVPTLLTKSGFSFDFPSWPEAAKSLVEEEKVRRNRATHQTVPK